MKKLLAALACLVGFGAAVCSAGGFRDAVLANESGLAINTTYSMNLDNVVGVSAQVVWSSVTANTATFTNGRVSTATFAITTNTDLSSATATSRITVTNGSVAGSSITIGGARFVEGSNWRYNATFASMTACNLSDAIRLNTIFLSTCGVVGGSVVLTTAPTYGSIYNQTVDGTAAAYSLTTASLTGGKNNVALTIGTATFTANVDYAVGASSSITATSLVTKINTSLAGLVFSSATLAGVTNSGIIYATSTFVGTSSAYSISSSSQGALTIGPFTSSSPVTSIATGNMVGGANSAITYGSAVIAIPTHGYTTGMPLAYSTGSAVALQPLVFGVTYYAMVVDANNIALSTTSAQAVAGSSITIVSSGTPTSVTNFLLTPQNASTGASWQWEVSNDNVNYSRLLTTINNVSISTGVVGAFVFPSTSTVIDFGPINYRNLQFHILGPAQGAIGLKVLIHGEGS